MTLPSFPPISLAQIPLLLLLTVAGAACLALVAEMRGRLMLLPRQLPKSATAGARAKASLGILLILLLASALLFLIGGLIAVGFGPFYLTICGALALIAIFLALGKPGIARHFETLSTTRLTLRVTALVIACFGLALWLEGLIGRS